MLRALRLKIFDLIYEIGIINIMFILYLREFEVWRKYNFLYCRFGDFNYNIIVFWSRGFILFLR